MKPLKKGIILILVFLMTTSLLLQIKQTKAIIKKGIPLSDIPLSTWIWDDINLSSTLKDQLNYFGIEEIYINTGWEPSSGTFYFQEHPLHFVVFIELVKYQGIEVQALLANNDWALSKNYEEMMRQIQYILEYNQSFKPDFSAIHLDIEPHKLDNWEINQTTYLTEYLSNLSKLREQVDEHNKKYKDNLKIAIDIPFWFCQDLFNVNDKNLVEQLLQIVDEIDVMNYTQNVDDFIDRGSKILEIADKYENKTIKIGVEFLRTEKDVTLFNFTPEEITEYIETAKEEFDQYESFCGFAIHDYDSYYDYVNRNYVYIDY